MAMFETNVSTNYDELIGGTKFPLATKNIEIEAGAEMKRGTIVDSAGVMVTTDTEGYGIVVSDVAADDTVVTVYTSGEFNREKLIVAEDDTVEAHEDELRSMGIYLTSIQ